MNDMADAGSSLVKVLLDWQQEIGQLLQQIPIESHPEGVLSTDRVAWRSAKLRHFRRTVMPRETRKQRFVWPLIKRWVHDGESAVAELKARKRVFEREMILLRWSDERSRSFDDRINHLIEEVADYRECEYRLLPSLATQIPTAFQDRAAQQLLGSRAVEPVAPHPDLPATPWAAVVIGPVAGVVDRVRDRFTTAPG
jgi:hypothetical protein